MIENGCVRGGSLAGRGSESARGHVGVSQGETRLPWNPHFNKKLRGKV